VEKVVEKVVHKEVPVEKVVEKVVVKEVYLLQFLTHLHSDIIALSAADRFQWRWLLSGWLKNQSHLLANELLSRKWLILQRLRGSRTSWKDWNVLGRERESSSARNN
jgi:hypothetical protein